jgi:hypothetical protein
LAILAKNQTEPEDAVSRFLHFQSRKRLKMAAHPCAAVPGSPGGQISETTLS